MIVGTAGHVDHGKTSLVKRLTGVDTDRLKEEKARGITIDLGFAYMAGAAGETIGFVDVPGHERFVRTMVAGAAGIDVALLVIAADEGVMPQTREHLAILGILGIRDGIIAVSKCDRVDTARRVDVARAITDVVAGTAFATAPLLFVSAKSGEGVEALREHLVTAASDRRPRDGGGHFRMSVDRVFSLNGVGTIVTGTALDGGVGVDDIVTVFPGSLKARVRSLHAQNRDAAQAVAGQRCALALHGSGIDRETIRRGSWICADPDAIQTSRFDAEVGLLAVETRRLASGAPIHFHCGASHCCGRIVALDDDRPGVASFVRITLDHATPLRHGDRFVLRDQSARRTVGGGVVLDPGPPKRERRDVRLARLVATRPRDKAQALERLLDLAPGFVDLTTFARQRGMRPERLAALRGTLGLDALKVGRSLFCYRPSRWHEVATTMSASLAAFHAEHPDLPGRSAEHLRQAMTPALPKSLFAGLCDDMLAHKTIATNGHWLHLPGFSPDIAEDTKRLFRLLRPLIVQSCFQPPRVRDMSATVAIEEDTVRRVCKTFARAGDLIEIGRDRYFLRETVAEMVAVAHTLSEREGRFHASAFRDQLGNGRKVAIEILEFFDRRGLTLRESEWRRAVDRRSFGETGLSSYGQVE